MFDIAVKWKKILNFTLLFFCSTDSVSFLFITDCLQQLFHQVYICDSIH